MLFSSRLKIKPNYSDSCHTKYARSALAKLYLHLTILSVAKQSKIHHCFVPQIMKKGTVMYSYNVKDITNKDIRWVMIRTVDTNVLVLAISLFNDFGVTQQLWIELGLANIVFLPIHEMCIDEIKHTGLRFILLFYWLWLGFIPC